MRPSNLRSLKAFLRKNGVQFSEWHASSRVRGWGNSTEGIRISRTVLDSSVSYHTDHTTSRSVYYFSFFYICGSWGDRDMEMEGISREARVIMALQDAGVQVCREIVSGWGSSGWRIIGSEHTKTERSRRIRGRQWRVYSTDTQDGNTLLCHQ